MPNENVVTLTAQVTRATTVIKGATVLVNGFITRLDAAVQAALQNGATSAELEPLVALSSEFGTETEALAAAVVANTPAA